MIYSTLRELIFAGTNFRFFRDFRQNRENLNPRNTIFCQFYQKILKPPRKWKKLVQKRAKPRKLVPAKISSLKVCAILEFDSFFPLFVLLFHSFSHCYDYNPAIQPRCNVVLGVISKESREDDVNRILDVLTKVSGVESLEILF